MKPERWKEIEEIYHRAQRCATDRRADFLDDACAGDEDLRGQIESLLRADDEAGSFLDTPALNLAAQMIAAEQAPSLIGKSISRYEIVERIGAGGMGEVYRARDIRLNRDVAIKVLPAHLSRNAEALARFEREARAVAALSHPNILAIHDYGKEQEICFAVTELLEGETLRGLISRSALMWSKAVEVGVAVADGLSAAHEKGIIHRDLKPENIFVTRDGRVKILDFGLARMKAASIKPVDAMASALPSITEPGIVMGTAGYMSPEQVRGEKVGAPSDIFSLGCVLYEMVAGRRAFAGRTIAESMAAILRDDPPRLIHKDKEVPRDLERMITRCLKKKAEERYPSARDLASDLKGMLSGQEISISPSARATGRFRNAVWITAALALLLAVALAYWLPRNSRPADETPGSQTTEQTIDSIAVLPLVNASGDADTEYLSDGLTEDLINSLSHVSKLRVIARTTVFSYKGREIDPIKVGGELKVRAVLTGRVIQHGDTLSIQADLLDVASGRQLWGKKFNKKLTDIFAVQEEIARQITNGLHLKLPGAEQQRLTKRHTENIEAYQLYLKGRQQAYKFNREGRERALAYFQQAIRLDPEYALAYAGLAEYHMIYSEAISGSGVLGREAAVKALALDETLTEAHYSRALVCDVYEWNWTQAERGFQRAIELSPGLASAHDWYGWYLAKVGRVNEAVAELKLAQQLDPLSVHINTNLGRALYFGRRYDQAIEQFQQAIDLDPNFWLAHLYLGLTYEQQARPEEALAEFQKTISSASFGPDGRTWFVHGLAVAGRQGEARKLLEQLQPSERVPWSMAAIYTVFGEKDQAFAWLEKAAEDRFGILASIKVDPVFDPLRSDPRFAAFLRRMGLEP